MTPAKDDGPGRPSRDAARAPDPTDGDGTNTDSTRTSDSGDPGDTSPRADDGPAPPRRRGRPSGARAGDPATRDRILAAARTEFSERGYDKASVRGIARAAGVDAALVHHYFGSKERVFEASIAISFAPALAAPEALAGDVGSVGERLTRFILGVWENPVTRQPLLAIVRSAVANETAAAVFRKLVTAQLMQRVADELSGEDRELRSELAAAQLVGVAMLRYVIKVEPLASADPEQVIAMIAPVVQRHLVGE